MHKYKTLLALATTVSLCAAQSIHVTGIVQDSSTGVPINGAVAHLIRTALSDTTETDGRFSIIDESGTASLNGVRTARNRPPVSAGSGVIRFELVETQGVTVNIHSLHGRLVFTSRGEYRAGVHRLVWQCPAEGLYAHTIQIGDEVYTLKALNLRGVAGFSHQSGNATSHGVLPGRLNRRVEQFADTLLITTSGYDSARIAITDPLTDGLVIRLTKKDITPDTGMVALGIAWMFLGDSQTNGYGAGEAQSHATAFTTLWNSSFATQVTNIRIDGAGGAYLIDHADRFIAYSGRATRSWVHFQESGSQLSGSRSSGQATAEEFVQTWETFVRRIHADAPAAVISTETAFSFNRDEDGRRWAPYNAAMREKIALLAGEGITVYLAEVDRNIQALDSAIGAGLVWFQPNEPNAYHYKAPGNLMVALSIFDALEYDVNQLDLSGISSVSAEHKAACLEIINQD